MIDCIVPAHNEESTIREVVTTLIQSGVFRRVIVVDDGSADESALEGSRAGADVIQLSPNGGKAEAMLEGVILSGAADFAFFDSDLVGLEPSHVQLLARHFISGFRPSDGSPIVMPDMVCGLQDHGWQNTLQVLMPLITGQRFVKRWVLQQLPRTCWKGYAIETALNFIVDKHGGRTCIVPMPGVTGKMKQAKVGFVKGWLGHLKMFKQMTRARRALEASNGRTCG